MMLIFQGGILPAGGGTASDDLDHLPVAGCRRAVPYTRLDELARHAPCAVQSITSHRIARQATISVSAPCPTTCNPRLCNPVVVSCVTIERESGLNTTDRPGVSLASILMQLLRMPHTERFVLACSNLLVSVTIRRAPGDHSAGASGRRHHGND